MVATPLSLFAALTAKSSANASVRDDASSAGAGFDFAALVNASSEKNQNTSSSASKRDDWQRSSRADTSSTSASSRTITPREAQRALDRLDRMSSSASASSEVRIASRAAGADVSTDIQVDTDTNVDASVFADTHIATSAPVDTVSSKDIPCRTNVAANDNATASVAVTTSTDIDALASLKAQLQAIVDSDTPASLQDITDGLPEADIAAALTLFPSASPLIDVQASADTQAPLLSIRQILSRLNQALNLTSDVNATLTAAANAGAQVNVETAATLPATLLDSDTTIDAAASVDTNTDEQLAQVDATATVITPLAQSLLAIPTVSVSADLSASTVATAAPTEAVAAVDVSARPVSIDTLIPSLTLSADDKKNALPEVELPKASAHMQAEADAKVTALQPVAPTPVPSKLEQQLQALTVLQAPVATGEAKLDAAIKPAAVTATSAVGTVSPLAGIGTTAGVSATASSNVVTLASNVINNAPIREQVHVAITKAKADGVDQITIQLDPVGLGRVEVKMHTNHDGQTSLSFLVDKPETFDALSRDVRHLERALQDSGLKADSGGMQFNLRQQTQADTGSNRGQSNSQSHASADISASASVTTTASAATRNYRIGVQDGIDIHA